MSDMFSCLSIKLSQTIDTGGFPCVFGCEKPCTGESIHLVARFFILSTDLLVVMYESVLTPSGISYSKSLSNANTDAKLILRWYEYSLVNYFQFQVAEQ